MRIIVDADACPGRDIIEFIAKEYEVGMIMFCDLNHVLRSDYADIKYIDSGFQSVDMAVVNESKKGDIVVSQDYGVAAMCLGKGAYVINPRGFIYDNENIERLLFERHIGQKVRKAGGKSSKHRKRNSEDDERLAKGLRFIIKKSFEGR